MASNQLHDVSRRAVLQSVAATGVASLLPSDSPGQEAAGVQTWRKKLTEYLERHARKDDGYAWEGQERSHLTPTFAVAGCYKLLSEKPPKAKAVAEFIRTHHPRELKGRLEQEHREFDWQQIQSLVWLGEDVSSFRDVVRGWKSPFAYPKQYERGGYPVFQQEVSAILSWKLVGLPVDEIPVAFVEYLNSRRRANGSFNNTPATDGSDGHVLNTWWGLQVLEALGRPFERKDETIEWLRACQSGGQYGKGEFTFQPKPEIGGWDDVAYTWAAVRSLGLLGARPRNQSSCVSSFQWLAHDDGGYGDRPQWESNPLATYYAIDALTALGALDEDFGINVFPPARKNRPRSDLKVFSIQLEAHGQGSPEEAVDLADALRIHLWGAKNAKPDWIVRAQALADKEGIALKFFVSNEEYGTWLSVPGMGTYSHMSDLVAPAGVDFGPSLANEGSLQWPEFAHRRLGASRTSVGVAVIPGGPAEGKGVLAIGAQRPRGIAGKLLVAGGRLIWQFGENEPLVRMLLDDSLMRGGYSAISTYHFGNPDFTNTEPFLMRYRGQIPFVALQDAHGTEPWWFADMTEGFRTLFLATKPTWEGWLEALKNNWVVAVRHDAVSGGETWMHGMPEVIEEVKEQWKEWQWWDNPAIERPHVSIVALKPTSEFETGRPETGFAVRVRCAFNNTTQGLPKTPITQLVKLMVAGKQVEPKHVTKRRPNGTIEDDYYLFVSPQAEPGRYSATATVRNITTGKEARRSIAFTV